MSDFTPYDPNAQGDDVGFDPPADGAHKGVTLVDTWAGTSMAGNDGVLLEWRTDAGYTWNHWLGFKSEKQTAMTWSQIGKLGVDVMSIDSIEALAEALKPHRGSYYDLSVKTNGEYRNVTIGGLSLGENPNAQTKTAATVSGGTAVPDDDIPFAASH
jgi:hypothetical protein